MSDTEKKELDAAQEDQDVEAAGTDPETTGPAENLREKVAQTTDESQESEEPA